MSVRALASACPAHAAACAFARLEALGSRIVVTAVAALPTAVCVSPTVWRFSRAWQPASANIPANARAQILVMVVSLFERGPRCAAGEFQPAGGGVALPPSGARTA